MEQAIDFCPMAERAIKAATAVQTLTEGGFKIVSMCVTDSAAFVFIPNSYKNKSLRGVPVGSTYHNCAYHYIFQANLDGVLVRWYEPHFDARKATAKVH